MGPSWRGWVQILEGEVASAHSLEGRYIPVFKSLCIPVYVPLYIPVLSPFWILVMNPLYIPELNPSIEYFFIWVSNPFCICLRKDCHTLVCFSFAYRNTDTGFSWRTMGPFTKKSFASCHVIYKQDCCIMPAPKRTSTLRLSRRRLLIFFKRSSAACHSQREGQPLWE